MSKEESSNVKWCDSCGAKIASTAKICPRCGTKIKQPFYKKPVLIILLVIIGFIVGLFACETDETNDSGSTVTAEGEEKVYEQVDLAVMQRDLKENALKAERTYNSKNIEVSGMIKNIDSDGHYVSIDSSSDAWDFSTVQCYLYSDADKDLIANCSMGETITIKGKVSEIGEVLGYTIDVDQVMK